MGTGQEKSGTIPARTPCVWCMLVLFLICACGVVAIAVYFGRFYDMPGKELVKTQPDAHVLILGAGLAGLKAAETLHNNGVRFTIIEGSNRIGGRIQSNMIGGKRVETGPIWIIGKENPVWKMAQKVGLKAKEMDFESYMVRDDTGADLTEEADDEYEVLDGVMERLPSVQEKIIADNFPDQSLRESLSSLGWNPSTPVQRVLEWFEFDILTGDTPERSTTKYSDTNTALYGDEEFYVTDQRGLSTVVDHMAKGFLNVPSDPRLVLNEIVSEISYNTKNVSVTSKSGRIFRGDYVLVTFSLGVLKNTKKELSFKPALPVKKASSILKYKMINYLQIYLKFTENFWDAEEFLLLASTQRARYPFWLNLNFSGLLNDTILMATVTGADASRVSQLRDAEVQDEMMTILRNIYGSSIPDPEEILVPRWDSYPLTMGAFPFWPFGMNEKDFQAFRAPIGRLHFAGDAASRHLWGYMQGAYESGEDEANNIIKCIRGEYCERFDYNSK